MDAAFRRRSQANFEFSQDTNVAARLKTGNDNPVEFLESVPIHLTEKKCSNWVDGNVDGNTVLKFPNYAFECTCAGYYRRLLAFSIACHIRAGVAGIAISVTPSGASASRTAEITAGAAPTVPHSPAPLAPNGFVAVGTSS